jgi:hypothetical protein
MDFTKYKGMKEGFFFLPSLEECVFLFHNEMFNLMQGMCVSMFLNVLTMKIYYYVLQKVFTK